jgi:ribonuclease HII
LRRVIETEAVAWAVAMVDNVEIDRINILNASIMAMHKAVSQLTITPELLLVDGNRFKDYKSIPHQCIIRGDGLYFSIAAASVLAKTYRDDFMEGLHGKFPQYNWNKNKGYPTLNHRKTILEIGHSPFHRLTFNVQIKTGEQASLNQKSPLVAGTSEPNY